jgi:hypothetical protein
VLDNRNFWIAQNVGLVLLYLAGLVLVIQGNTGHLLVKLDLIILVFHLLEIPWAFKVLKPLNPQPSRVIVMTLVFGLLWWVPASRRLFAVR